MLTWAILGAVALTGILGGVHCAGMCGGIVAALSGQAARGGPPWRIHLSYNLGRIASYTLAGALAGALGSLGLMLDGMLPVQIALYVAANVLLIALGLYLAGIPGVTARLERIGARLWRWLKPLTGRFLPADTVPKALALGMLWGWLPCGLVYAAISLATTAGNEVRGALTMLSFGIGTLPAVVGVGIMTSLMVRLSAMRKFRQLAGVSLILLALLAAFPWINPGVLHGHHGGS